MMTAENDDRGTFWLRVYRVTSITLAMIFAIVGVLFLVMPDQVLAFFNGISLRYGLPPSPSEGAGFFLILAAAYMYLVTLVAFLMYRNPGNSSFAFLLVNGKAASSILSILFILVHGCCLIYIVNAVTDGSIALGVFLLNRRLRRFPK